MKRRQRCLIQKLRNVRSKVGKDAQEVVKRDFWAIFDLDEREQSGLKLAATSTSTTPATDAA